MSRSAVQHRRLAAAACLALFVTMFLPWYSRSAVGFDPRAREPVKLDDTLNAFQVFSFVEAAVLLVALAVLYLLWAREQRKAFHLPGGDGTVIAAAGIWVCLLVFWRQFDQPDADPVSGIATETGVSWGIFVTFLAGALLAYAGVRMRRDHVPEPPLPAAEGDWVEGGPRRPRATGPSAERREPRPPRRRTDRRAFDDVPAPAEPPTMRMPGDEAPTTPAPPDELPTRTLGPDEAPTRAVRRPTVDGGDQLSFDDS
ncbi:hypothetical protein [Conexibacter sp. SYSU D00693]|uniref:hypothetical protein n=1 Tax=Conexibacter sp. SYSU D00693 TaxID=2812560 RepID=UPI00196B17AF|nr:hypothetical protein [Conexibacter sp. SYSU D00693]